MFANGDVLVQKFGGSSMGSAERIELVARRIAAKAQKGHRLVVVVSAMADTTDDLIGLMNRVAITPDRREYDQMLATGEMISSALAAVALQKLGVRARSFNAFNLHLLSEMRDGEHDIVSVGRRNQLARFLEPGSVAVVAGFQGISAAGDLTTLGRGGSDLTAVVLAHELGQKLCEKYTDENGIYTADPRIIPLAKKIWHLNYDEMLELAQYGNGILHPRAISRAAENNIRIHVRSSFSREEGSVIGPDGDHEIPVKSIASDNKFIVIKIQGAQPPDELFTGSLYNSGLQPTLMQWVKNSEKRGSLRLAFKRADAFEAIAFCWEQASRLNADEVLNFANLCTVTLVGEGVKDCEQSVFITALKTAQIKPVVFQADKLRLSFAVNKDKAKAAIEALHHCLVTNIKISS
jgi:aspartate kinase